MHGDPLTRLARKNWTDLNIAEFTQCGDHDQSRKMSSCMNL